MSAPIQRSLFFTAQRTLRKAIPVHQVLQNVNARESAKRRAASEETRTPEHNPQNLFFFPRYGSSLPTSLTHLILWGRCCEPWRPDAVMGTTKSATKYVKITNIKMYVLYTYIYAQVSMRVSAFCVAGRTCLQLRSLFATCKGMFTSTDGRDVQEHEHTHMLGKRWVLVYMSIWM